MVSKAASTTAFLLCINLVFFTVVSASSCPPNTPAKPTPKPAPATPKPSPATPKPSPSPAKASCPKDTLKFGVCGDLLKGVHVGLGTPLGSSCCALISDLADAEAAVCLCTAIKANIIGVSLNAPVSVTALLNNCGKKTPKGFKCA